MKIGDKIILSKGTVIGALGITIKKDTEAKIMQVSQAIGQTRVMVTFPDRSGKFRYAWVDTKE